MTAFYNDNDPKVCAWVEELMKEGLVMQGDVVCAPIQEIKSHEIKKYVRVHLFCGIAGWDYALRLAKWPESRQVVTCSCPCQPYSTAGQQKGNDDDRNLWPQAFRIIRELNIDTIFGEQVENAIRHGWLDGVSADLEGEGYAVGSAVLGAHSVGSPHRRQRLYWVADSAGIRRHEQRGAETAAIQGQRAFGEGQQPEPGSGRELSRGLEGLGASAGGLANSNGEGCHGKSVCLQQGESQQASLKTAGSGTISRLADASLKRFNRGENTTGETGRDGVENSGATIGLDDSNTGRCGQSKGEIQTGRNGVISSGSVGVGNPACAEESRFGQHGVQVVSNQESNRIGGSNAWHGSIILCKDGKYRRISAESSLFPLAPRLPGRVGLLRGAGNSIVPQVAAEFIKAYLSI